MWDGCFSVCNVCFVVVLFVKSTNSTVGLCINYCLRLVDIISSLTASYITILFLLV